MIHAVQIGPLLLPFTLLLVFASAGLTLLLGRWLSRAAPEPVDQALWRALLVGVVAARLGFVYEYRALYLASPLDILDIRDGGWNPTVGLLGVWMSAIYRDRRTPSIRKPLRAALAAGTAVFLVGMTLLALNPAAGQKLPPLVFESLEGRSVALDAPSGKPTIVNLWATWCPPCVREMPVLLEAQRRHPELAFVFLNQGESAAQVTKWLADRRLPLQNVLLDPRRQASAAFKQQGYPTTLFFNARGELVSTRLGELSAATLEERLQGLTDGGASVAGPTQPAVSVPAPQ